MIEYIYIIQNTVTGMVYVGRTNNPASRKRGHFSELKMNVHCNPRLQNSFNKHGEDSFTFSVVDSCDSDSIYDREAKWFDRFNRDTSVMYNCHFETFGGPVCTDPLSEETKHKISEAIKDNTRKYIFDILSERYETKSSLKFLADKYGVGMNTMCDYVPEWEALTGLKMFKSNQIEQAVEKVGLFIDDYDKGKTDLSKAAEYNTTVDVIKKYCVLFDREPEEFKGSSFKEDAKLKALKAIAHMQQTGCTALDAIRKYDSSVTTFYKYLKKGNKQCTLN